MYSFEKLLPYTLKTSLTVGVLLAGILPPLLTGEPHIHTVMSRDTLFSLALEYGISVEDLKDANKLDRDMILLGEDLLIPSHNRDSYKVQSGETLSGIALKTDIPLKKLISLNQIEADGLKTGMELELVRLPDAGETRTVQAGDTLSWISLKYDTSIERLKQINNLSGNSLKPGQVLELTDPRPQKITIKEGDSLWKISSQYNIALDHLKEWNNLEADSLKKGQTLQLYAVLLNEQENYGALKTDPVQTFPQENRMRQAEPDVKLAALSFQPPIYYSKPTERRTQPDRVYSEEDLDSPLTNYKKASRLLQDFDRAIEDLPALGRDLAGYKIVLDPGHGGVDPGAIVENHDGRGNRVFVVEDEYCYDIALRVYKDLKRYGANVFLTVISPNQTIRQSPDASLTFVNEKNEVWNEESINRLNLPTSWPVGSREGLNKRVELTDKFLGSGSDDKTLFISIHADNQPYAGEGTIVVYHENDKGSESEQMADFMTDYLGMGSYSHPQEVRVLLNNPAEAAVLIETRNLAFPNNSWAIRNEELRQDDADRIVRALCGYASYKDSLR